MKNIKIGLCLSGGGARGAAHIGALQALNENGIYPSHISGSSAGALVGSLYCSGYSPLEILELSKEHSFLKIFHLGFINKGFTDLKYLEAFLTENLKVKTFEELKVPLSVGITDINKGIFEIRERGDLMKIVMASCSIPLLFKPVEMDGSCYLDGGIMNNLPIEPLQKTCSKLIGLSLCPHDFDKDVEGIMDVAERIFHLGVWNTMEHRMSICDIAIELEGTFGYGMFDLKKSPELFEIGYNTMIQQMNEIQNILK